MKADDYFPTDMADAISDGWVGSLDRKKKWSDIGKCALLVLDLQRSFTDPSGIAYLPSSITVMRNVSSLLDEFPGPIFFTRHSNREGEGNLMTVWWRGTIRGEMAELDPDLDIEGYPVIDKSHYSAFVNTNLEEILVQNEIETVVISGVMTDLCCETTARDAFMRGFKVIFLADCTATETEERHIRSLRMIAKGFGEVLTSRELLLRL
jgi:nicotinamidase-related amidase